MLTNEQMKENRFGKWAVGRKTVAKIKAHLEAGGEVWLPTMTRCTVYKKKHAEMFVAKKSGPYVQRGKSFDYIGFGVILYR